MPQILRRAVARPVVRRNGNRPRRDREFGRLPEAGAELCSQPTIGEWRYAAKTWNVERQVVGRVEASAQGTDSRFIVTNLNGAPRWLYEELYCARGQAENLIKAHKLHLASDRTSCTRATANQFRLLIHTVAYWLMHTLRGLAPARSFWRDAQFDTLRLASRFSERPVVIIGHS